MKDEIRIVLFTFNIGIEVIAKVTRPEGGGKYILKNPCVIRAMEEGDGEVRDLGPSVKEKIQNYQVQFVPMISRFVANGINTMEVAQQHVFTTWEAGDLGKSYEKSFNDYPSIIVPELSIR